MKKDLYKKYVALNKKLSDLEDERTALRTAIIDGLKKEKTQKVETKYGKFTIAYRTTWSYSDAVKKLKEKVKLAEVKEQQSGIAEEQKTEYLVYTEVKEA